VSEPIESPFPWAAVLATVLCVALAIWAILAREKR
jgi:hypothetical protein